MKVRPVDASAPACATGTEPCRAEGRLMGDLVVDLHLGGMLVNNFTW